MLFMLACTNFPHDPFQSVAKCLKQPTNHNVNCLSLLQILVTEYKIIYLDLYGVL